MRHTVTREKAVVTDIDGDGETVVEEVVDEHQLSSQEYLYIKIQQALMFIGGLITVALLLRFTFMLLNARPVGIVAFLYQFTQPLVALTKGIFSDTVIAGGGRLEVSSIMALVLWSIFFWLIRQLVVILFRE